MEEPIEHTKILMHPFQESLHAVSWYFSDSL